MFDFEMESYYKAERGRERERRRMNIRGMYRKKIADTRVAGGRERRRNKGKV